MTPKEARSIIRGNIILYREQQIALKAILHKPHGPDTGATMRQAAETATALTYYHNALNELCGRPLSHNYKELHYCGDLGAYAEIHKLKSEIIWPEKPQATA